MVQALEISEPKNFGMREVILTNVFCILPYSVIGTVTGVLALSLGMVAGAVSGGVLAAITFLFFLTAGLVFSFFVFPVLLANPFIRALVEIQLGPKQPDSVSYVCQIALRPRLYDGLRGFLEDADDIGRIEITGEGVLFGGDHVTMTLPFESILGVTEVNPGYRLLWIAGSRIRLHTDKFDGVEYIEFLERESNTIPTSRRLSREIVYAIEYGIQLARADVSALPEQLD